MVLPAILAGAAVGGALLSYMQTQKAMKMNAAERARISALISKIQQPNFDFSKFTPEDYKLVGEYAPQVQSIAAEAAPQLVQDTEAAKQGTAAQRAALQRFMEIGQGGPDINQQVASEQAARQAAMQSQGSIGALNELQQRQGQAAGGGLAYGASLAALQGQNQNAALTGQQAALDAYRNRLDALKSASGIGAGLTGQERQLSGQNADIINQYNARMSGIRGQNLSTMNEAQRMNLAARQNVSDQNISGRNEAFKYNQQTQNELRQRQYENAFRPIELQAGVSGQNQQANMQGAQQKANAIMGGVGAASTAAMYANQPSSAPATYQGDEAWRNDVKKGY